MFVTVAGQFGIGPEASLVCMLFSHYQKGKLYSGVMAGSNAFTVLS